MFPNKALTCFLIAPAMFSQARPQSGVEAFRSGNYQLAAKLLPDQASRGDAEAQCCLGSMYMAGKAVLEDYSAAVMWFRRSSEQGHPAGQFLLGKCYFHGWGVEIDWKIASSLFIKAADKNIYDAEFMLGMIYYLPFHGTQDKVEAHAWFNLAATHEVKGALDSRDLVAKQMTKEEMLLAHARAREILARRDRK